MNSADLAILQREAEAAAKRLARRLDLSADARCDICQELLVDLLADPDPDRAHRAMQAMMTMGKIDIAAIEAAVRAA